MAIYEGKLLVFGDIVLSKDIQAPPPPPEYYRTFYNIVSADSDSFNCVWADINSSQTTGKVYFSTPTGIYAVDLAGKFLYQQITSLENNITSETLISSDIVDLNVVE